MKKIGIVGGVAWRSTVDYYSGICSACEELALARDLRGEFRFPEITIESLDHSRAVAYLGRDDDESSWHRFDCYHREALERLASAGCDFALIASNTPHHRFSSITRGISIPVIDLFQAAAAECGRTGAAEALILGTIITMTSPRLREEFAKAGARAECPADGEARRRTLALIEKLQSGALTGAEREIESIVLDSVDECCLRPDAAVCLACTELPLAFPEFKLQGSFERNGIRYINTTAVHIRAAVDCCFGE